jgi:hypothetical protein
MAIFFLSTIQCVADDDKISVKPLIGRYVTITLSGNRTAESCQVKKVNYEMNFQLFNPELGAGPELSFQAIIESSGSSDMISYYEKTFTLLLPNSPIWTVSYHVKKTINDSEWINVDNAIFDDLYHCGFAPFAPCAYFPTIRLTDSNVTVHSEDTLLIHNMNYNGYEPLWSIFQWDPATLSFTVQTTGLGSYD